MSRYVDINSTMQVIGSIYLHPDLLGKTEKYHFSEDDFPNEFHQILFGSINNLYASGITKITITTIESYLESRPKPYGVYKSNKGREYLEKIIEILDFSAFDYYYTRVKKFTLLRAYDEKVGMDLSWLYDKDNILDPKKKEAEEKWLDDHSIEEIAEIIDKRIERIKLDLSMERNDTAEQIGYNIKELIQDLQLNPDYGIPMYGSLVNAITEGAKLGKMYLRSGLVNTGKTRGFIADICYFSCTKYYTRGKWQVINEEPMPTLFISTEQTLEEVQTMCLAFISGVQERHIKHGEYEAGEWERVMIAADILQEAPLYVDIRPDFSLSDIENSIKYNIFEHGVKYIAYDYIHSSLKILSEISGQSGVKGLREDNILFMLSAKLKDIALQYDVFIITSTQLNGEAKNAESYDQNLLRGAKAIADRVDIGTILLPVSNKDLDSLSDIISRGGFPEPNIKMAVYKNRSNEYKSIILWGVKDLGVCRVNYYFCTTESYEFVDISELDIQKKELMNKLNE